MSVTKTLATTVVAPEQVAGVAQLLSPVVINLVALSVNGKQLHWHVRGDNFVSVHELLDDLVAHAQAAADVLAERVVALGLPVDARVETVAEFTQTPKLNDGFIPSERVIQEAIAQIDAVLARLKTAVDELGEIDPPSQDAAIEVTRQLDKDRWFFFAHLRNS